MKQYWRALILKKSLITITVFLQYFFTLTAGKMAKAIAHPEEHLPNPKTSIW
jgi:hypothetical protein